MQPCVGGVVELGVLSQQHPPHGDGTGAHAHQERALEKGERLWLGSG